MMMMMTEAKPLDSSLRTSPIDERAIVESRLSPLLNL
jgi:hypothetical protein